jgi:SAM-dependent methyltransferase
MNDLYDDEFFDAIREWARSSASVIAPLIVRELHPRSVIDVGCGSGEWLAAFAAQGVTDYIGIDGNASSNLAIPPDRLTTVDLLDPISMDRRFDLAISLEVAEHLPPERAAGFVADLCGLAPRILFSAAIPGQGGTSHVNERWPSWWSDLFNQHGYGARDLVRPLVWADDRVTWFYSQNMVLYEEGAPGTRGMFDVVHPQLLERYLAPDMKPLPLRALLRELPTALERAVRSRVHRPQH